jgi:hypothetical protein
MPPQGVPSPGLESVAYAGVWVVSGYAAVYNFSAVMTPEGSLLLWQ